MEEERRLLTALFCDMVGFTPLNELLDAEDVRRIQGMYFRRMSEQLHRFGGSVEKYAGDAVLALFGNPVAHEDDPERAVRCAIAMQDAFKSIADMAMHEYGRELAVRIGINTGELVSGAWAVEGRIDFSATGDALNTAARLQTAADPGDIIVGPMTMHLARRAVRFGPRRDLTLKGKSELFPAYPVLGLREKLAERWETGEERSPLVGRDSELALLARIWEQVQAGEGGLTTVVAEAGVGKSRLLAEAVERMSDVPGTVTFGGRCLSHGAAMSMHLIADLLRTICHLHEGDALEQVRGHVRTTVDALLAPQDIDTRNAAADVLGSVLGLPPSASPVTHAGPQIRRQTLVRSLQLVLSALSSVRPAIVLLEDLHWVDDASVEILEAVLPALHDRKAMVLLTRRPGRTGPWEEWPQHTILHLHPLGAGDALGLARAVLGGVELEHELEGQIIERADGNPYFVEELLRSMQDTGALEVHNGRLGLRPGAAEKLPATLTELLLARLDQLDRSARLTAQLGSVIGRTFAVPLLSSVADKKAEGLREPLEILERAEIALPRRNAEQEYTFKHATIREVAYNTLLRRRRVELHAATARAIIRLYPADEQVDVIAFHFSQTREHGEAATWLERSGDRAASIYANAQAIEQYREARRRQDVIDASPADRARVDEKLGRILRVLGRYGEAHEVLEAALEALRGMGDAEGERRVAAEIGRVHRVANTPGDGIARITQTLDVLSNDHATSGLAALHVALARLYFSLGRYEDDLAAASRGSELAREAADPWILAEAEQVRGTALYYLRRMDEALGVMEDAIPLAEAIGNSEVLFVLLGNVSVMYRDAGDIKTSLQHHERKAYLAERTGNPAEHAFALASIGELQFLLGDWSAAETHVLHAQTILRSLDSSWFTPYPFLMLGRIKAARGEFDDALRCLEEGIAIATDGSHSLYIIGLCFLAEMHLLQGQPEEAILCLDRILGPDVIEKEDSMLSPPLLFSAWAHLESGNLPEADRRAQLSVKRLKEENSVIELLLAQRVAGMVAAAEGDFERAAAIFDEVLAWAREVQYPHAEACTLYEYGIMCTRQGNRERALAQLGAALRIFQRLGDWPNIDQTQRALMGVHASSRASIHSSASASESAEG